MVDQLHGASGQQIKTYEAVFAYRSARHRSRAGAVVIRPRSHPRGAGPDELRRIRDEVSERVDLLLHELLGP